MKMSGQAGSMQPLTEKEMAVFSPDADAGFGALRTEKGLLPLKAMDVRAHLDGLLAEVTLSQTFVNAYAESLEATYIFPLPDRAAVTGFRLEVAGRIVEADLKEREAARQEYEIALKQGHRAAIAEEERPGVFTLRVGNLPAGESATVRLTLTGPLQYDQGEVTFRFPLVVAPRYIPGKPLPGPQVGDGVAEDTDAVPDASRIAPPVLLPGYPYPVRLSLSAELLPGLATSGAGKCSFSVVEDSQEEDGVRRLVLRPGERANRDFILRFPVAEASVRTLLTLQPDREGNEGTFALTLVPPANALKSTKPRDVVFVLDRSGSMQGWKMLAARRALGRMIDSLSERDRFTILAFDDCVESSSSGLTPATDRQRFRALEFLGKIEARNGTEMAQPLDQAVKILAGAEAGREATLVLVTDGQVGNEDQILKNLGKRVQGMRIFTLGIDQAVNEGFLKRLALLGGGFCELVESEDRLDEVMAKLHRRIAVPQLTGLKLEAAGLRLIAEGTVPGRLPDLFAGAPVQIFGRYQGASEGSVNVSAKDAAGRPWSQSVTGQPRSAGDALSPRSGYVATAWARAFLRELEDHYVIEPREALERQIVQTSLKFGVLCRFTAFVAVDRTEQVSAGGPQRKIVQPVEAPAGWEMLESGKSLGAMPRAGAVRSRALECFMMPADDCMMDEDLDDLSDAQDEIAASAPKPRSTAQPPLARRKSLLGSIGGLFGGAPAKKRKAAPVDLSAFRLRVAEMLPLVDQARANTNECITQLGVLAEQLAALVEDCESVGAPTLELKPLHDLLKCLRDLVAVGQPAPELLVQLCDQADAVLRTFAGLKAASKARRAFWK